MTKLLQIPQKSGLNQNNIMVASATEQQIQSRAIIDIGSATLPLPIICTTQLYGVKTDGTIINQAQVVCNSSQRIHVAINVQTGHPFSTVSQALLLIKKVSGSGSFAVFPATANNVVQSGAEATNFVTEVTLGSDVYFAIDITAQVRNNAAKMIYLAICSESGSSCTLCSHLHTNKPGIDVAFVKEDPDFSEIVPIEDAIGANGAYSVNVRNGKLMYTQRVYQAPGGYLPFALSMSYCATDYATAAPNNVTRPLTGWIFNYDQSIRVIGNNLIYLDGNHRYHEFVPAGNSSTVWSNATAKDGTYIIQKSDGTYQLTDGKAMTMNFNTDNRLAEIVAPNSQKIEITYTGGNISQIVVGSQATYTLTYSSQTITLKKGNVVLSTITLNSAGRPTAVTNGQPDNGYTFAYNGSQLLSKVTDIASKQVAEFAYNTAKGVASVKRSIKNPTEQASSAVFFTYDNKRTIVSHCRNTHSVGAAYKKMEYLFAEDGTLLDSFERIGIDKYEGLSFKDKDDYMLHYSRINASPYWDVDFNGQKSISLKTTSVSNAQVSTAEKIIPGNSLIKQCVLTGQALVSSSNYVPEGESGKIAIYLMDDGVELCHLEFDGNSRERQVLSKAFELTDESHTIKVIAKIENMRADVLLDNIKLIPLLGSAVTEFTTSNTRNDNHEDHEGVTWYEKDKVSFTHNAVELVTNVKYTQKDHLLTMQSKAKDPTNFNVWYNDGANVLCGVNDDVEIKFAKQPFYSYLREHTFCSRTFAPGKEIYSYPVVDTVLKVVTKTHVAKVVSEEIVHDTFQTEQCFNTQGQVTQEIDQDGVVTTYTYNSDGQLTKTRVEASGSLMNIEQSNTYYDNKMLKSTVEKRESSTYSQLYFYGTNLELTSETFPNGLSHYYTYSPSNDMLTTISTTQSNADPKNVIAYDGDLVTRLTHNGTTFCFAYDTQNNIDSVQIEGANTAIISKEITYDSSGTTQSVTTYGNGQKIKKYYDKYDRLIKASSVSGTSETVLVKYIYSDKEVASTVTEPTDSSLVISANSKLRVVIDTVANTRTVYTYDAFGNVSKTQNANITVTQTKDAYNRVVEVEQALSGSTVNNQYVYASAVDDTVILESVEMGSNIISTAHTKDGLQRPTETKVMQGNYGYKTTLAYIPRQTREWIEEDDEPIIIPPILPTAVSPTATGGYWETTTVGTTPYISTFKEYSMSGSTATLVRTDAVEYDANGNITKYGDVTYVYDKLNRLIRENNPALDKTFIWSYNALGNRTEVREYAYTTATSPTGGVITAYIYGNDWKQLIVLSGTTTKNISYDSAGNPTNYKGATLTWTRGRLLASYKPSGSSYTTTMQYDANGVRCSKTIPTSTQPNVFRYVYDGNNLVRETKSGTSSYTKTFLYNSQGIVGFAIGSTVYTYRKNLFGDIIAIYQGATKKAAYLYDAWGNCTITQDTDGIGTANPFRYRGYYWDNDLQLYYLMSRYYDPATGRFINADSLAYLDSETIGGLNLYAYCLNNPVMFVDQNGNSWDSFWNGTAGKIIGTALVIGAMIALSIATAGAGTAVVGALGGGFWAAVAGGAVGGAISGAIFGVGTSMISQGLESGYSNIDYGEVAVEGLVGMASGAASGALFAGIGRGLGLLGKTKWAQRTLENFDDVSKNYMFGSKSGNFTFFRNGKSFRLESSLQHGLHYHSVTAGTTAEQWKGIFKVANSIAGLIGGIIGNAIY